MTTAVVDRKRPVAMVKPLIINNQMSEAVSSSHGLSASCASEVRTEMSVTSQTSTLKPLQDNCSRLANGPTSQVAAAVSGIARVQTPIAASKSRQGDADDVGLSRCPFYHGSISVAEAKLRLRDRPSGTFLLRDSRSGEFPFALSVRTEGRGHVTSVRIARCTQTGLYRLDCDDSHRQTMPSFSSVLALVEHFSERNDGDGGRCVLISGSGRADTPLTLTQPLENSQN